MISATFSRAFAIVALLVAAPLARLDAQAAAVTMPKQAAQRAANAANTQLATQMGQAHAAQAGASGSAPARTQASVPNGAQAQQPGNTAVVQSGTPDPGAPGPRAGVAAPDPSNAIMREVFEYTNEGRRDPFFSLMTTGDIRPMLADLRLTTILYDPTGRRPVAVMNDVTSNLQYRVTTGMMLGRMRVTQIKPRAVIFAIEEFGYSRADSILLADKPNTRK